MKKKRSIIFMEHPHFFSPTLLFQYPERTGFLFGLYDKGVNTRLCSPICLRFHPVSPATLSNCKLSPKRQALPIQRLTPFPPDWDTLSVCETCACKQMQLKQIANSNDVILVPMMMIF
jgi:hypothetical protein